MAIKLYFAVVDMSGNPCMAEVERPEDCYEEDAYVRLADYDVQTARIKELEKELAESSRGGWLIACRQAAARAEEAEASHAALLSDYHKLEDKMLHELQSMSDKLRVAGAQREAAKAKLTRIMEWARGRCNVCGMFDKAVECRTCIRGRNPGKVDKWTPPQAWEAFRHDSPPPRTARTASPQAPPPVSAPGSAPRTPRR